MKFWSFVILTFSTFTILLAGFKTYEAISHPIKYQSEIISISKKYNIEPYVVASVINIESSYKKNSRSNRNAIGLMQIKLDTANYLNDIENINPLTENELFTPSINIEYGCKYLHYLIKKFEDLETSLAAYNAGETRVRSWLKSEQYSTDGKTLNYIPYSETKNYIIKFKNNLKFYKKYYNSFKSNLK